MLTSAPNQGKRLELRDLERAIAKLPEEQRSVLLLVGLEGMRYEEVAAVLDVPVGTIRSRLSRGREMLRQLMGMAPERPEPGRAAALRRVAPVQGHSEITFERPPPHRRSPHATAERRLPRKPSS